MAVDSTDGSSVTVEEKIVEERPKWDNKVQYLLTCIGFAVGLGNVWRFPYLCQVYGGGAFLIPYLIALVFEGLPLLYLELAIGQRLRLGSIGVWNSISPYLGGVGVASMLISFLIGMYYCVILAWVLWYFFHAFEDPLPWSECPVREDLQGYVQECVDSTPVNYFWYRQTLNVTSNIETNGSLQWWLVLCLATAWCVIYICFIRGIETIGKAVYITATFPYLVLTIFLVQALTLPGATEGLIYLFTPDWELLKNPRVWLDAATQIFFSLSLACGGLIAFSSYNSEKNNCERDTILVGCINSATSLYASISIFAILGFKAMTNYNTCLQSNVLALTNTFDVGEQNITVENYESWLVSLNSSDPAQVSALNLTKCDLQTFLDESVSGTGLAFIVFTEAVISMPGSQVWAVLFFIMLFSLGLSSVFGCLEGVLAPLNDLKLLPKWLPSELLTALIVAVSFLLGLMFTMGSGNYWLEIFNNYVGSVSLLLIAFFEIIGVVVFRGMKQFSDDIEFMTGKRPNLFWRVCWMGISPALLVVVFVAFVVIQAQSVPTYHAWNPDYVEFPQTEVLPYPDWVFAMCVLLVIIPVAPIPIVALYRLIQRYCCRSKAVEPSRSSNPYANEGFNMDTDG
ncbi:sodium-dependent neutral amino acid transporter B(0)AT3-like [Engraulis encrasicolus]|uniref:sodium-dependent neutral amino acid transporter B(0)AT3-like n=1 Tax=Engraulis encrasicolus TaxID=184585 RepID=UPI002FD6556D